MIYIFLRESGTQKGFWAFTPNKATAQKHQKWEKIKGFSGEGEDECNKRNQDAGLIPAYRKPEPQTPTPIHPHAYYPVGGSELVFVGCKPQNLTAKEYETMKLEAEQKRMARCLND